MRRSLRNRLALAFFAITFVAIVVLYVYVAPGLRSRLISERLNELEAVATGTSGQIVRTVGSPDPLTQVVGKVDTAALRTGDRVTLLLVTHTSGGLQLSPQADSSNPGASAALPYGLAYAAASSAELRSGTVSTPTGKLAMVAYPVTYGGRVADVIVYSASVSDVDRTVSVVRRQILIAGALALLLALVVGYLVARALARRVKRLELAAEQVAGGDFEHTIPAGSADELGQLARAFNQMQHQLAQLSSAREKFIATASHELRTPIFSLGGFVELLEDEELDEETRKRFLVQVRQQVERLRKLSVDLLDLSKLESGSLELRPEEVDLGELTRSVSGEFEPALAQHDSHLELRLAARHIDATCDPVRVAQIVRILIDNALTHTQPGTRIVVTAGRFNGNVRLSVRDNGQGIDTGALPRVFEPFYTGDDVQGSGLGLAIASELAERMAGRLSVDSQPGTTTFTLEIPD
ncbi:MAG TPA: HAMP domain-containing sensor histidine kinase [Solirubrobacteraceae bacterium]|nr:HAMP domain-containing sensor histidine kinase [Solirubrobacteraceae bacterium]